MGRITVRGRSAYRERIPCPKKRSELSMYTISGTVHSALVSSLGRADLTRATICLVGRAGGQNKRHDFYDPDDRSNDANENSDSPRRAGDGVDSDRL